MRERRQNFDQQKDHKIAKNFIFFAFAVFSFSSLFLGTALCLLKSPESKSDYYLSLSSYYQAQLINQDVALQEDAQDYLLQGAKEATLKSIYHAPYNAKAWQQLSSLLNYSQETDKAVKAREITKFLGLAEMPVLLPSRDLSLSKIVIQNSDDETLLR